MKRRNRVQIFPAKFSYNVYGDGGLVAESRAALVVKIPGILDRIFIPKCDVAMAFFDRSGAQYDDPHLGKGCSYHFVDKNKNITDVACSYSGFDESNRVLDDYLTFDEDRIEVLAY